LLHGQSVMLVGVAAAGLAGLFSVVQSAAITLGKEHEQKVAGCAPVPSLPGKARHADTCSVELSVTAMHLNAICANKFTREFFEKTLE
jgi:hypothetical protein